MIDSCPVCRYLLTGLPDEHVCPECGFGYERDAVLVEEHRYTWKHYVGVVGVPILLMAGSWLRSGRLIDPYLVSLAILTPLVAGLWRTRRPRNAVLVSRQNLRILRRGVVEQQFPLADIRNAEWSSVTGSVVITGIDGETLFTASIFLLQSHRRAKTAVSAINEYVRVCSSP